MKFPSKMNKVRHLKVLFLSIACMLSAMAFAQEDKDLPARPNPPRLVNDMANIIADGDEAALEQKLVAYNDSTSSQIAVITLSTVQPYAIADYAYRIGRKWGVGQKDKDNGIVILIAVEDRDMFIATGYGVEGYLPDIATKRIIDYVMVPEFQKGDYYAGIDKSADEIFKYMTGAYEGTEGTPAGDGPNVLVIIIIVIILLIIMSRFNKKGGGTTFSGRGPTYWGGGGFGGFGGGGFGGGGGGGFGGFGGGGFGGGGAGGSW